ncbi:4-demethylwyosine synthase TYW1 [Candidatus Woesearchaeota archaeon]|nr:4-demethylwyosine synthase TYW1 [Candidatus Woesearchaeota archaeon]
MLTTEAREELEKQQYKIVGQHSAVKTCGWTKKMIRGEGGCYKFTFYGIKSHQCMQMTTSISCANRCEFCWRGYKAPVSKEWTWGTDDPEWIIEESISAQRGLMYGFKGNPKVTEKLFEQSMMPEHVALSLTGEPIMYPKINEICEGFHKRHISTFLVTNAQYPEAIRDLKLVTQLYISVDAPNKELLKKIDKPLFPDYWERLNASLDYMSQKDYRTVVRLTCVKDYNMCDAGGYASLILKGDPDFIEVKAYMWVGASQERLKIENMPSHEEVKKFGISLLEYLPDYEYVSEHIPSRVILLAKKSFGKKTWIDFSKFFKENGFTEKQSLKPVMKKGFMLPVIE